MTTERRRSAADQKAFQAMREQIEVLHTRNTALVKALEKIDAFAAQGETDMCGAVARDALRLTRGEG